MDDFDDFEFDQLLANAAKTAKIQRIKPASTVLGNRVKCNLRRSLSADDLFAEVRSKSHVKPCENSQKECKIDRKILEDAKADVSNLLNTKVKVDQFLKALSVSETRENIDPSLIRLYIIDYKRNRVSLALELFALFNRYVFDNKLPSTIKLEWNSRLRSAAGIWKSLFSTKSDLVGAGTILLSKPLLDSPDKLRDTLIHEMCHAATTVITKERDVHGPFWRYWTMRANLEFPSLPRITRCHRYK